MNSPTLLEIRNLHVTFALDEGVINPLRGVNIDIHRGEVHGFVGESGCGKSVTSQAIMRIIPSPGKIKEGEILFHHDDGAITNITKLKPTGKKIQKIRGDKISMIFQEPMSSFSSMYTIGNQVSEMILLHEQVDKVTARERAIHLLDRVGIPNARERFDDYPFQFSGGMRQRAMIATALACHPSLLIADEPTTALDVTIQAQVLKLIDDLQREFGMAVLFITHNMGVVAQIADRISVMYLGKIIETGSVIQIFSSPKHPYTTDLLQAIPIIKGKTRERLVSIGGNVPGPYEIPRGCAFHPRCSKMINGICNGMILPPEIEFEDGHKVSCFLYK